MKYKRGLITGCFDLFHHGHRKLFEHAKAECDVLIIGLASDDVVTHLKGAGRPIVPYAYRLAMLEAVRFVDEVREIGDPSTVHQPEMVLDILPDVCFCGPSGNPFLQQIIDEFQLGCPLKVLDTEVIHTSDLEARLLSL